MEGQHSLKIVCPVLADPPVEELSVHWKSEKGDNVTLKAGGKKRDHVLVTKKDVVSYQHFCPVWHS